MAKFSKKHLQALADMPTAHWKSTKELKQEMGVPMSAVLDTAIGCKALGVQKDKSDDGTLVYRKARKITIEELEAWAVGRAEYAESVPKKPRRRTRQATPPPAPMDVYSAEVKAAVEAVTALAKRNAELEATITKLRELIA